MSTENQPMRIEFTNPTCLLWAVLALARLHEKLPSHHEAIQLLEVGGPWPFRVRSALNDIAYAFTDHCRYSFWELSYTNQAGEMLHNFKRSASGYYYNATGQQLPDDEFLYLFSIIEAFHLMVGSENAQSSLQTYNAYSMLDAIEYRVSKIIGQNIFAMFQPLNALIAGHASDEEFENFAQEQVSDICSFIEQFIRDQADLKTHGNYDPNGNVGEMFVRIVRAPLHAHVESSFKDLLHSLCGHGGGTVDANAEGIKAKVRSFLSMVATFFSYSSPLLCDFWIRGYESEEEDDTDDTEGEHVPEHVANHDFERYGDQDWFSRELVLTDVQDVLLGPEHAGVDDVSILAPTTKESYCGICGDHKAVMRKVKVCGHDFCVDCLDTQLKAQHECRYRCSSCRAEFFEQDAA